MHDQRAGRDAQLAGHVLLQARELDEIPQLGDVLAHEEVLVHPRKPVRIAEARDDRIVGRGMRDRDGQQRELARGWPS